MTHAGFGPDLAEVFGPAQQDGGPELVQLLTPEGERVEHPDFSFGDGLSDDELAEQVRGFFRDMVLTRRIDVEATALQRHGELGIWAQLLGQEAAQIGAGRALRPQDYVFPTYREHGVAYCKGVDPLQAARPVPRRRPGRLGPPREQLRPLHDRDRRPDPARHRLRDGHAARRRRRHRRPRPRRRGDRPLRRRRLQPGRRQRGVHLRRVLQRPGRVLLPEQPVGDLRADRAPDADPALPAGSRLRLPRRPRRRQRRARDVRRDPGRAAAGPRRPGPDPRRGLHLPDGCPHHDRRPDPLPALRRRRALEAEGPDRPRRGLPQAQRPGRPGLLRRGRAPRPTTSVTASARAARRCRTRSR